jgi:hypothetical protein
MKIEDIMNIRNQYKAQFTPFDLPSTSPKTEPPDSLKLFISKMSNERKPSSHQTA